MQKEACLCDLCHLPFSSDLDGLFSDSSGGCSECPGGCFDDGGGCTGINVFLALFMVTLLYHTFTYYECTAAAQICVYNKFYERTIIV